MEKILKSTSFSIDVFNAWCHYTNDFGDFCKIANNFNAEIGNENVSGKCIWIQNEQGISKFLIGCFNGCDSTLAHECTNAALFIFQKINERVYYDSEAFPHLVGTLFNKCKQVEHELNRGKV